MGKKVFTNGVCMMSTGVSCALGAAVYCNIDCGRVAIPNKLRHSKRHV